ncbi:MAG: metal ABC transporter permease [Paracoccaceae bacterium]|nr:metal ABC transporter permease [Paracoccaceae bacterium]
MIAGIFTSSWIAGSIVAAMAGVVGFFVVLRGASFAAHALPLCAFPALAAAHLFGLDPLGTALAFALAGAATISAIGQGTRRDIASAIWLVLMLALGELFLSRMHSYARAVYGLLFGQLLGVTPADLHLIAGVGILAALLILLTFRPLLLSTLAPELAVAAGVPPRLVEFLFLALLALASSAALPAVGALLCFSLMVGPASAARHLFDRPTAALAASVALSLLTVWGALLLSSATGWPASLFVGAGGLALYLAPRARSFRSLVRA